MGHTEVGLPLPSFRRPPVVEVAMSFGFPAIVSLHFAALADLRSMWRKSYPRAEEQPFLESVPVGPQQSIKIEVGPPPAADLAY